MNAFAIPDQWDIEKTRELLSLHYGVEQLALAKPSMRAVLARMDHARYHFQEARAVLRRTIDDRFDRNKLYDAVFFVDPQGFQEIENGLVKVEAHMIASAQAIHAISDTLAHVVYFSLGLNLSTPMRERGVTLESVVKAVVRMQPSYPSYSALALPLTALNSDKGFKRIQEMVNHSKHRGIPEPVLALQDPASERLYDMLFGDFAYDGADRPRMEMQAFLESAYAAVSRAVIDTGNAINKELAARSTPQ